MALSVSTAYQEKKMAEDEASVEKPVYSKFKYDPGYETGTQLFSISVNEGWRQSILCDGMYEWAADWLIEQLQGKPFAPGKHQEKL